MENCPVNGDTKRMLPLQVRLTQFDGSQERCHVCHDFARTDTGELTTVFSGATWEICTRLKSVAERADAFDGQVTCRVTQGAAHGVAVAVEWPVAPWSREVFVMVPAAAYNGNRYASRPGRYPPMLQAVADIGPNSPILITDVPRLNQTDGAPSRLQLLTGDATTPCLSFYNPRTGRAGILLTEQGSRLGNHGLTVEESLDRTQAVLRIEAPGVRRGTLYTMVNTATPTWDCGADWMPDAAVAIRFRVFYFPAAAVQDLYDRFAMVRQDFSGPVPLKHELPFSAAWRIVEEKYQRENWCAAGYYRVGTHAAAAKSRFQDWQVGWVGGGMVPFPLLIAGQPESRQRASQNIEWMFREAQHPSGLFHAGQHQGVAFDDGFNVPGTARWYMVRKQADALYFLVKAFYAWRATEAGWQLPNRWAIGIRRLADRFVATFRKFGQLGQYLDYATGDVVVGGSTAAALAPGALALAGQFFTQPEYIAVAASLARQFAEHDVRDGLTTGGPGEILKCADSESAFALLESFIVLYEVTHQSEWLACAEAQAVQCLTWCVSYDYIFPKDSWFGRLNVRAAGSIWANVQNKHSAPGICTLSGDALFKLFRYTGQALYLEQIQATAHNLPQYIARADRPVGDPAVMKPGYISERVNLSDWEGRQNVGGNLFGSCWPEVSLMLTTVELPGVYVQSDTGRLCVLDHLNVRWLNTDAATVTLECCNPTAFDAEVRILVESSAAAASILGQAAAVRWPIYKIPAGATRNVIVNIMGCATVMRQ